MRVSTSKSKNAESFYITKSYINNKGKSTSKIIRKLGTLEELSVKLGTDRDGVMEWAKEQADIETLRYKEDEQSKTVLIPFHSDRQLDYGKQVFYKGGYLFLQSVYYGLKLDRVCRKIRPRHKFEYDINAILSGLVYTRIPEPSSKRSSFQAASQYLEPPFLCTPYIYRALSVLAGECDFIQSEVYKNSFFFGKRSGRILYYDCTNYYFEIEQKDGEKNTAKARNTAQIRSSRCVCLQTVTVSCWLSHSFQAAAMSRRSLKPLEKKILQECGHDKFIYCSDAGLGSEADREFNHMGQRAFIVSQPSKKLPAEERKQALERTGFKRAADESAADITSLDNKDKGSLFYKDEPYTTPASFCSYSVIYIVIPASISPSELS